MDIDIFNLLCFTLIVLELEICHWNFSMKKAIENNPLLMESLKNEVETQVQEKLTEVGIGYDESLNKSEYEAINNQLAEKRKISENVVLTICSLAQEIMIIFFSATPWFLEAQEELREKSGKVGKGSKI
jgi:hypothetical protein